MDRLEQELKKALSRKEPKEGFDERVRKAVKRPKVVTMPRRWLAAAAAVVVLAGAGGYREYRGYMAKEQVMQAMRITGSKLNRVQTLIVGEKQ